MTIKAIEIYPGTSTPDRKDTRYDRYTEMPDIIAKKSEARVSNEHGVVLALTTDGTVVRYRDVSNVDLWRATTQSLEDKELDSYLSVALAISRQLLNSVKIEEGTEEENGRIYSFDHGYDDEIDDLVWITVSDGIYTIRRECSQKPDKNVSRQVSTILSRVDQQDLEDHPDQSRIHVLQQLIMRRVSTSGTSFLAPCAIDETNFDPWARFVGSGDVWHVTHFQDRNLLVEQAAQSWADMFPRTDKYNRFGINPDREQMRRYREFVANNSSASFDTRTGRTTVDVKSQTGWWEEVYDNTGLRSAGENTRLPFASTPDSVTQTVIKQLLHEISDAQILSAAASPRVKIINQ